MANALIAQPRSLIVPRRGFRKPARPVLDPNDPINRGLQGCWPLGDVGLAGITKDISKFANHGTLVGSPPLRASHHGGLALQLVVGSSQYVDCSGASSLDINGPIRLSCWTELFSYPTDSGPSDPASYRTFLAKKYDGTEIPYFIDLVNSSGTLTLRIGSFNNPTNFVATWAISGWSLNTFHHLYGGYDGSHWIICFDGVQVASASAASGALSNTGHVTLGALDLNGTVQRFLDGSLDAVRIASGPASQAEAARLFSEPYAGIVGSGPRWWVGAAAVVAAKPLVEINQSIPRSAYW